MLAHPKLAELLGRTSVCMNQSLHTQLLLLWRLQVAIDFVCAESVGQCLELAKQMRELCQRPEYDQTAAEDRCAPLACDAQAALHLHILKLTASSAGSIVTSCCSLLLFCALTFVCGCQCAWLTVGQINCRPYADKLQAQLMIFSAVANAMQRLEGSA